MYLLAMLSISVAKFELLFAEAEFPIYSINIKLYTYKIEFKFTNTNTYNT
jgi:hypothetical protein